MRRSTRFTALALTIGIVLTLIPTPASAVDAADAPVEVRSDYEVTGTDSVGRMLADLMEDEDAAREAAEETGYGVSGVTFSGRTASVTYTADASARIVVRILDDETERFVTFASADADAGTGTATVTFADALPDYFIASACLLDPDTLAPLSDKYTTTFYVEAVQELQEATTDDFDPDLVLNLDTDETNNFLVYDESVVRLGGDDDAIGYEDGICTITGADAAAKSLRVGDVFSHEFEDGQVLIVKVRSIRVDGDTVTIEDDPDADLEDAFSVIKIDSEAYDADASLSATDFEGKKSATVEINKDFVDKKTSGGGASIKGSVTGTLKVEGTVKLYHERKYTYFEFKLENKLNASVSVEGKIEAVAPLGAPILLWPVPGVIIKITPSFLFEASAEISGKFEFTSAIGRTYETGVGWNSINETPRLTKVEAELEGTIFIGLSLEPDVKVLYVDGKIIKGGLIDASLTAKVGLEFKASATILGGTEDEEVSHDCDQCFDGDISFKVEISGEIRSSLEVLRVKGSMVDWTIDLGDFYLSIRDGAWEFGWGECPYIVHNGDSYAILYDDGTLVFQNSRTPDSSKTVVETYPVGDGTEFGGKLSSPWHSVQVVDFAGPLSPKSTALWFYKCSLTEVRNIHNLDTSNVTSMDGMFCDCYRMTTLDLSNWDTSNVKSMSVYVDGYARGMFDGCRDLTTLDLSGWDTSNVTNMYQMFYDCSSLTTLDLSNWDTSNVTNMDKMFWGCSSLTTLDLSNWDTSNVTNMDQMFCYCSSLTTIYASDGFDTSTASANSMFTGCTSLVGGNGTVYDEDHDDGEYARIDDPPDAPGYFTLKS